MRSTIASAFAIAFLTTTGCQSTSNHTASFAQVTRDYSTIQNPRDEALRDANEAIRTGTLYICEAGTIGIYAPGISRGQYELVKELKRRLLPSGCTNPKAERSIAYAEIFNAEIVRHIRRDKGLNPEP